MRSPSPRPAAVLALLAALLLPAAAARASDQQELWTQTVRAVGLMVEGKLEAAVVALGQARKARAVPELDALVGLAALEGGEPRLATRELDSAIRRGSTEPLVFYWAARAELAAGRRAAALKRLRHALSIGDRPQLHMAHALLLHALKQPDAAARALVAAARGQPNLLDPSLYPTPLEGAVDLLGRVLAGFPAHLQLVRTEGHLLWRASRVTAACRRFTALLSKRPSDPDALQMQARCRAAMGQTRQALDLARRAVRQAGSMPQALATRGEILLELGRAEEAIKDLRKAADALPRDARLLTRLAQACTEAERPACAEKFFAYALRRQRTNAAAAFGLALSLQQKQPAQAESLMQRALLLAPERPRYWKAAAGLAHLRGDKRLARQRLAESRRARTVQLRIKALQQRMARVARAAADLTGCLASPNKAQACVGHGLPGAARQFARLHWAAKRKHHTRARGLAAGLLPRLRLSRLILKNPTIYLKKAHTLDGRSYRVRITFPLVPPWSFGGP